jgi:CO/xanthine dehydrogenase Mo-binding subunit
VHDGAAIVRGMPDRRCTLREIAAITTEQLQAEWRHETTRSLGSLSVHVCVVAVDTTTGEVHPETYFVLCDVGRAIDPTIVDGQLVGGVVFGLGHATLEELVYNASGQLVTGTLMDYALPRADGVPAVEIVRHDVPAPSNPLGVKGAGEAGTSGVGAALANAVANAVGPAAARHLAITASRVLAALDAMTPSS